MNFASAGFTFAPYRTYSCMWTHYHGVSRSSTTVLSVSNVPPMTLDKSGCARLHHATPAPQRADNRHASSPAQFAILVLPEDFPPVIFAAAFVYTRYLEYLRATPTPF